jgi:hypothetical protein
MFDDEEYGYGYHTARLGWSHIVGKEFDYYYSYTCCLGGLFLVRHANECVLKLFIP